VENSPASRAGIVVGDRILQIDKASTRGMSLNEVFSLLRGSPTRRSLSPSSTGAPPSRWRFPWSARMFRESRSWATPCNPNGSWNYFLDGCDRVGYLRISGFTDETPNELKQALTWLTAQGMRGWCSTCATTPAGTFPPPSPSATCLSSMARSLRRAAVRGASTSAIWRTAARHSSIFPWQSWSTRSPPAPPRSSAACLQDNRRAVIVASAPTGKGTVQELIDLEPGCGAMKLTTSSYWRPSGKDIRKPPGATPRTIGALSPDEGYKVALTKDEFHRWQVWRNNRDVHQTAPDEAPAKNGVKPFVDRQRRLAIEYVEKEAASRDGRKLKEK